MPLKNIEDHNAARRRFILVADSNARNLQHLTTLLKRLEYDVYAVRTAEEVLDLAAVVRPVLIVTARQLNAGHTALELIRAVKSANPACTAPVIVHIAKPDAAFERECLSAGALVCLHAPVTVENFYRVIQVAIEPIPRMTIRISADLPATINGARTDECVRALSEKGAYIQTSRLYPLNTRITVRIKLSGSMVSADAVVIYSNRTGHSGMGLQFTQISPQDQQRIRMFIRSELFKGVAPLRPGAPR
jgi:CheY-like chemotaxis protein